VPLHLFSLVQTACCPQRRLGFFNSSDTISLAHVGTPENREEGLAGLEEIAKSLRFD